MLASVRSLSCSTNSIQFPHPIRKTHSHLFWDSPCLKLSSPKKKLSVRCSEKQSGTLRTCKNCKTQFDPSLNHPQACRFHSAHFGGETKRKFESVYEGGTMNTRNSGQVFQYWHCCGAEDPFDPGCSFSPHLSYDD